MHRLLIAYSILVPCYPITEATVCHQSTVILDRIDNVTVDLKLSLPCLEEDNKITSALSPSRAQSSYMFGESHIRTLERLALIPEMPEVKNRCRTAVPYLQLLVHGF